MNTAFYALGSVIAISLVSLIGLILLPLREGHVKKIFSLLIPLAVGALLGDAFFHLIPEAFKTIADPSVISLLLIAGIVSFFFLEKFLRWHHHASAEDYIEDTAPQKNSRHLGHLILFSDGVHNFVDGIVIGVSYLASIEIGIATTLAIVLHEIPQEIGDFGVLLYAGYSKKTALLYNFLSALTAVLGTALVLVLGSLPQSFMQGIIPFAAGTFIYIASSDLVPELHKHHGHTNILPETIGIGLGVCMMYLLLFLE